MGIGNRAESQCAGGVDGPEAGARDALEIHETAGLSEVIGKALARHCVFGGRGLIDGDLAEGGVAGESLVAGDGLVAGQVHVGA